MPRCPYNGVKVWNRVLGAYMHKVAEYVDSSDGQTYGIYSDMMPILVKLLKSRIADRYQNVVGVHGEPGSGKSTLGIKVILELDPKWEMEPNYCYKTKDILEKFAHWSERSPLTLIDEGTKAINSLNARSKDDNTFVVLLDTMRSFGGTVVIATPNFWAINKRVRNDHVNLLLALPDKPLIKGFERRGFYQVYLPSKSLFSEDVYWVQAGAGIYEDLSPEVKAIYEPIKLRAQLESLEDIRKRLEASA